MSEHIRPSLSPSIISLATDQHPDQGALSSCLPTEHCNFYVYFKILDYISANHNFTYILVARFVVSFLDHCNVDLHVETLDHIEQCTE